MHGIFSVIGAPGSGKTSFAAYICAQMAGPATCVLSNCDLNEWRIPNCFAFDDDEMMAAIRTASAINDLERLIYVHERAGNLPRYERSKFTQFIIILDEAGAVANGKAWAEFFKRTGGALARYTNQNRKINMALLIVTPDGSQVNLDLRRLVNFSFYSKPLPWPLSSLPVLKHIKLVRKCRVDAETGDTMMDNLYGKDENGQPVVRKVPMDWFHTWYWQPTVWGLYDDLKKNIRDPERFDLRGGMGFDGFEVARRFLVSRYGSLKLFAEAAEARAAGRGPALPHGLRPLLENGVGPFQKTDLTRQK